MENCIYWEYESTGRIEIIECWIDDISQSYISCSEDGSGNEGYTSHTNNEEVYQIKDNNLKPCMKKIMDSIKTLSNDLKGIIKKFSGNSTGFNWELKDGTTNSGSTAQTSTNYNVTSGTVSTTFDTNQWNQASDLSWVRTILHESIHAYVISVEYNTSTSAEKIELLGPNWLNRFTNKGHDFIANNYIEPITDALVEYGAKKGYNLSRSFYKDLAWGGLQGTDAFNNYDYKDRALNVIKIEATKKDMNGNTKTQKGQDAGC